MSVAGNDDRRQLPALLCYLSTVAVGHTTQVTPRPARRTLLPVTVDLLMRLEKRGFWKSWVEACLRILDNMLSLRWQAKDPKLLFIAPAFHPVQLSIPYAFLLLCVSPAGSTMPHRMLLAGAADVLTRFLRVLAVRDADMAYTLASGRRLLKCKCAHEIADEVGPELPGKLCQRIT